VKYGLVLLSAASPDHLELSGSEFQCLRTARTSYLTLVDIEEKFDIIVEAYFEYERTRLDLALRHTMTWDLPHIVLTADMRIINLRLLSLLASAKLYLAHLSHDFAALYGRRSSKWATIDEIRKSLEAGSLSFQIAKVLRDHIQHRGLPVNTLFYRMTKRGEGGQRRLLVGTDPQLDVHQLERDRSISKDLLNRLREQGERIPVAPLIKEYFGCLGELHRAVREVTSADADIWERDLRGALVRAEPTFGRAPIIAAVELHEDGSYGEEHQIFDDLLELRLSLLKKNALLSNLAHRFVSLEHIEPS